MDKAKAYDDLKDTLELWVQGLGAERPDELEMAGIELILELMKRAEERS